MYFLTNYCLFMSKVENNNITIWKISILILYISHSLFFAIKCFTKNNDFWHKWNFLWHKSQSKPGKMSRIFEITTFKLAKISSKILHTKKKNFSVELCNDNTGELFYQDEEKIHKNETTQVDTEGCGEKEKTMIQDIELRGFNKTDRLRSTECFSKLEKVYQQMDGAGNINDEKPNTEE